MNGLRCCCALVQRTTATKQWRSRKSKKTHQKPNNENNNNWLFKKNNTIGKSSNKLCETHFLDQMLGVRFFLKKKIAKTIIANNSQANEHCLSLFKQKTLIFFSILHSLVLYHANVQEKTNIIIIPRYVLTNYCQCLLSFII